MAKSRIKTIRRKALRRKVVFLTGIALFTVYVAGRINLNPVSATVAPGHEPIYIEKPVEVVREVEVDRTFTTEKQQIMAYMVEKFGDDAGKAIAIVATCENSSFNQAATNHNRNGTVDYGVMQINSIHISKCGEAIKTDWKANIDCGHAIYKSWGNKFTAWTCAHRVGEKNYLGQ